MAKSTKSEKAVVEAKTFKQVGFGAFKRGPKADYERLYLNKGMIKALLDLDDTQYDNILINVLEDRNGGGLKVTARM